MGALSIPSVDLTSVQQRTLDELIQRGKGVEFSPQLADELRQRIDGELEALDLPEDLWLFKSRLNKLAQCGGMLAADLAGEEEPFELSPELAAGNLVHKAIELDVAGREEMNAHALVSRAAEKLEDTQFGDLWRELDPLTQDELLMDGVKALELFRGTFPPLRDLRRELTPVTEAKMRAELAGGAVMLSGRVDLMLGAPDRDRPHAATRLLIDLKSRAVRPEHAEDMRLYALIHTLRFGVPPYRVASLFLETCHAQPEDVTEEVLDRAADRVVAAARAAAELSGGKEPELSPGPWCRWCPRALSCPESLATSASPAHPG